MENINVVDITRDKSEELQQIKYLIESKSDLENKIQLAKEAQKELVHVKSQIKELMKEYLEG